MEIKKKIFKYIAGGLILVFIICFIKTICAESKQVKNVNELNIGIDMGKAADNLSKGLQVNERIPVENYEQYIKVFIQLIKNI